MPESASSLGFRMPAEWERHEATWIGWPHNASDWPGKMAAIPWVYAEIVRKLAQGEVVRALVNSRAHERRARAVLARSGVPGSGSSSSGSQRTAAGRAISGPVSSGAPVPHRPPR